MPTPVSKRYLSSVKIGGVQPAQIHIFSTKTGLFVFKLSWQKLSPPSPNVESKMLGPYKAITEGVEKCLIWHGKKFKYLTDYDYG